MAGVEVKKNKNKREYGSNHTVKVYDESEEEKESSAKRCRVSSPSTTAASDDDDDDDDDEEEEEQEEQEESNVRDDRPAITMEIGTEMVTQTQERETTETLETIFNELTALREQTEKQKTWLREFEKVLDGKEHEALQKLELLRTKLIDDKNRFRWQLLSLFKAALGPVRDDSEAESDINNDDNDDILVRVPYLSMQKQGLAVNLNDLLNDCHELTTTYHSLADNAVGVVEGRNAASMVATLELDLEKDRLAIQNSIMAGRKLVQKDLEELLSSLAASGGGSDGGRRFRDRSPMTREEDALGRQLLAQVREDDSDNNNGSSSNTTGNSTDKWQGIKFAHMALAMQGAAERMEAVGKKS